MPSQLADVAIFSRLAKARGASAPQTRHVRRGGECLAQRLRGRPCAAASVPRLRPCGGASVPPTSSMCLRERLPSSRSSSLVASGAIAAWSSSLVASGASVFSSSLVARVFSSSLVARVLSSSWSPGLAESALPWRAADRDFRDVGQSCGVHRPHLLAERWRRADRHSSIVRNVQRERAESAEHADGKSCSAISAVFAVSSFRVKQRS